jgi:hypothetical protein
MQDGNNNGGKDNGGGHSAAQADWMQVPAMGDPDFDRKVQAVYSRLGHPPSPKDYRVTEPKDFQLDDADKEYRASFLKLAHKERLTQRQVNALENWQIQNAKLIRDAQKAAREDTPKATRAALEKEYGPSYGDRVKGAYDNMKQMNLAALADTTLQDGRRLGDTFDFVRMAVALTERQQKAADAASYSTSGSVISGSGEVDDVKAQIRDMEESMERQGIDPTSKKYPHRQLEALYAKAYGTKPLNTAYGSALGARHRGR